MNYGKGIDVWVVYIAFKKFRGFLTDEFIKNGFQGLKKNPEKVLGYILEKFLGLQKI